MTSAQSEFLPAYLSLLESGELAARVDAAFARLEACDLCAHHCRGLKSAGRMVPSSNSALAEASAVGAPLLSCRWYSPTSRASSRPAK